MEFDIAVTSGNTDGVEFCVMSEGGTMPSNTWDNYAAINSNANMLFDITAGKSSTSFAVNGTETNTTLASGVWHHVTLHVDQTARSVAWEISNGDAGTFALPVGTSSKVAGFYLVAGRYYSAFRLDNIRIHSTSESTFAFRQPGTLRVTTSADGCLPSTASYDVRFVGVEIPAAGYTTFGCDYAITFPAGTFRAYIIPDLKGETVNVTKVLSAPARTGLLLKGDAAIYRLPLTTSPAPLPAGNMLVAVLDASGYSATTPDIYVLDEEREAFLPATTVIAVGSAYLKLPASAPRHDAILLNNPILTGIAAPATTVATPASSSASEIYYTPAGQRTTTPRRGIYILRGRKVVR